MKSRWKLIVVEFAHHLPYTIVGSLIAMAGVWWFGTQELDHSHSGQLLTQSRSLFHFFHPLHICLSAIAPVRVLCVQDRIPVRQRIHDGTARGPSRAEFKGNAEKCGRAVNRFGLGCRHLLAGVHHKRTAPKA
jgi:hypothetical protein